jgi:hypothetical protein
MGATGLTFTSAGKGVLFQYPGASEGKAVLSLLDMSGRTVWSGVFAHGATHLTWDGRATNGTSVSSGVYSARLTLLDKQGKAMKVVDRKVPYTR